MAAESPDPDRSAGSLCLLKDLQVRLPQRHVQLRFLLDSGCGQSFFGLAAHGFVQIHAEVVVAEVVFRCSIPGTVSSRIRHVEFGIEMANACKCYLGGRVPKMLQQRCE